MCDITSPLIASCSCCHCSLTDFRMHTGGFPVVCSSRPQLCCFVLKQSVIWCTLADLLLNDALLRCCLCNLVFLQFLNFNINTFIIVRIEATTAKASCSRFPSKLRKSKCPPLSFCFNFVINPREAESCSCYWLVLFLGLLCVFIYLTHFVTSTSTLLRVWFNCHRTLGHWTLAWSRSLLCGGKK